MKDKNLMMMPSRVAIALQSDGWYLRSMIPWLKRNVMPESVNDRPTTATEYVFMLSKSDAYYYDKSAVMIAASKNTHARLSQDVENQVGTERANGGAKTNGNFKAVCSSLPRDGKPVAPGQGIKNNTSMDDALAVRVLARNRRNSDWFVDSWQGLMADDDGDPLAFIVNPQPYREAHFATWPPRLVLPMVLAGSRPGDVVGDCFFGSGTTGMVAIQNGRRALGIELNPDYCELARQRCETTIGLPL